MWEVIGKYISNHYKDPGFSWLTCLFWTFWDDKRIRFLSCWPSWREENPSSSWAKMVTQNAKFPHKTPMASFHVHLKRRFLWEISISVEKFDVGICFWHILYWITQPLKISVEVLGAHPTGSNFRGKNRMRYVYLWSEWWVSYALAWSCSAPQTWTTTGAFLVFTSIFAVDTLGRKLGTNSTRWIFC